MKKTIAVLLILVPLVCFGQKPNAQLDRINARAEEIVQFLSEQPAGLCPSIENRSAWEEIYRTGRGKNVVGSAERWLQTPLPEYTDEIYLDFVNTGNRTRGQKVISERHGRFFTIFLAECLENKGRLLPELERLIADYCQEKSWHLPAHDRNLGVFNNRVITIDLASSDFAFQMAVVYRSLGARLSASTRKLIEDNLEKRCFQPYESYVKTGRPRLWWGQGNNNWNAVCHAGVVGAALYGIDDPRRRAFFIAAAEENIKYFISGFTSDGYCSEGLGYWGYGFGNYVKMSEMIRRATGNKIDLMRNDFCELISKFPQRIEIMSGVSPAFADCAVGVKAPADLMTFLNCYYGWNWEKYGDADTLANLNANILKTLYAPDGQFSPKKKAAGIPLRDYFDAAGILVCRPCGNPKANKAGDSNWNQLGAAFKAGHNAEFHNHNDVGAYTIVYRGKTPLADVGGEVYTARTFGSHRYDSRVLNSWGHAVPLIGGVMQSTGSQAKGVVGKADFSPDTDTFSFDFRSCYEIDKLEKMNRTFVYNRKKNQIQIIDEFKLAAGETMEFNDALTTFSEARREKNALIVGEEGSQVQVKISAVVKDNFGKEILRDWEYVPELCGEDQGKRVGAKRLGVVFPKVNNLTVTFTISPIE